MSLLTLYLSAGIFFLIIEMVTTTFYGLALSITTFVLALYVFMSRETDFSIIQAILGLVTATLSAYWLPQILRRNTPSHPQGLEQYIGRKTKIRIVGDDLKITLDGVEYLVESADTTIKNGDRVEITAIQSWVLQVQPVSQK